MRVLVTWGSKRGGTEGIGRILAEALASRGFEVVAQRAEDARKLEGIDAAIVGGALYGNRWPASVRRFVGRNVEALRKIPVWFFSSGPLDDSADRTDIPATNEVAVLGERVGAKAHVTFGGRLEPDAKGFPASAMAREKSGDWRNPDRIRTWGAELASTLPDAAPGAWVEHGARSVPRWIAYAVLGWALSASVTGLLLFLGAPTLARVLHTVAATILFGAVAWRYFRARGAREPLSTAIVWTAIAAVLDLTVVPGAWISLPLIFLATWTTGSLVATLPWSERPERHERAERKPELHAR